MDDYSSQIFNLLTLDYPNIYTGVNQISSTESIENELDTDDFEVVLFMEAKSQVIKTHYLHRCWCDHV